MPLVFRRSAAHLLRRGFKSTISRHGVLGSYDSGSVSMRGIMTLSQSHLSSPRLRRFAARLRSRFKSTVDKQGILGAHDLGGAMELLDRPLDLEEVPLSHWEIRTHALLVQMVANKLISVDELRRHIEGLPDYDSLSYYEKWTLAICASCIERGIFSADDVSCHETPSEKFSIGDFVRVKEIDSTPFRRPHLRSPGYIHGSVGIVERHAGTFKNPEQLAFREDDTRSEDLYRVRFNLRALWNASVPDQTSAPSHDDTVDVDIFATWLTRATESDHTRFLNHTPTTTAASSSNHHHETRHDVESNALSVEGVPSHLEPLSDLIFSLLTKNGHVSASAVHRGISELEDAESNNVGADIVVRAWQDDSFKQDLLADTAATLSEIGVSASNYDSDVGHHEHQSGSTVLTAVENTPSVHNLVCCTLCSCYPTAILGLSPAWYKSSVYRARAVRDPRSLLSEFGTTISNDKRIAVHDSTADLRYIVIPERPVGTESLSSDELRKLVTRDSMIGVSVL